jgi:transposase-like protein
MAYPVTLVDAVKYFSDEQVCINEVSAMKWPDGQISCSGCGEIGNTIWLANQKRWKCRGCKKQFSVKVGTIFHDSPLGLDKWMVAMWMLANCRNGISSYEVARTIGITQKSAWHMLHRIREAMADLSEVTMGGGGGAVEVDEAFVGGKLKNMHKKRASEIRANAPIARMEGYGSRLDNKTPVVGMFDRGSRTVRAKVVKDVKRETLQTEILKSIKYGSQIYTDQAVKYDSLRARYIHDTVNHAVEYVRGQVHTNCLENFWSLTKRNLSGTYVAVEPFHLDRYLDEQVFRFNLRHKQTDANRFKAVLKDVVGRRLTYAELTGKGEASAAF